MKRTPEKMPIPPNMEPVFVKLLDILNDEPPLRQIMAVELLLMAVGLRMGNMADARKVVHAMHKHALQLVDQIAAFDGALPADDRQQKARQENET